MNEVVGFLGLFLVLAVVAYGVYIISKPHKFKTNS